MNRILVTGGSGFIGRYTCERIQRDGGQPVILDLVEPAWNATGIPYIQGDVRDRQAVDKAIRDCNSVIHLAAAHHDFGITEATYFDVNEGSAHVLCDAMDRAGIRDACFYSSVAVYGTAPEPRAESVQPAPASPYGASKLAGEHVFQRWTEQQSGRRVLVIRPAVVFGPRNFANMYVLIRQIYSRFFLPVGPGTNVKSTAYVENVVDATFHLLSRDDRPGFDAFNYVDTPDLTSREICDCISEAMGRKPISWSIPVTAAVAMCAPFDAVIRVTGKNLPISSARVRKLATAQTRFPADKVKCSGFVPRVSSREGLRRMTEWFLADGRHLPVISHLPPARIGDVMVAARKAAGA